MPDEEVRVLIVGLPTLLRDLFEQAFAERGGYTVIEGPALDRLGEDVDAVRPDLVLVPLEDDHLPSVCRDLLAERGRLKVVGVASSGNARPRLVRLLPDEAALDDASPVDLIEAVERAAAGTAA